MKFRNPKRTLRLLSKAGRIVFFLALVAGGIWVGRAMLSDGGLLESLSLPDVVAIPFWAVVMLFFLLGILLVFVMYFEDHMDAIGLELADLNHTLRELEPLLEEGRWARQVQIDREMRELDQEIQEKQAR